MPRLSQRGAIQFVLLLILLAGIIGGVYLVQKSGYQIFKPKAAPTLPQSPEVSLELELESDANSPFPDNPTPSNIPLNSRFRVDIYARSDIEAANLFSAKVRYSSDTIDFVEVNRRAGQTFVKNWVDTSVDNEIVSLVGGLPDPGIKTDVNSGALLLGSIIFQAKRPGTARIELTDSSEIFSNSSNINILTVAKGGIEAPIQDVQPSPSPSPIAHNNRCTAVLVEGGVQGHLPTGGIVYIVESEGNLQLTAQVIPIEGSTATWTVAGRPTGYPSLPNNGGSFDYPEPGLTVKYTAPRNTGSSNDNLNIESNISTRFSDGFIASTTCGLVAVSVKPAPPQPSPSPSPTPITTPTPTKYQRAFVTSTTYNGNLGGLAGADSKCQERANAANLGGAWKAWLSDNITSAASRLTHHTTPYKLMDGTIVANDWNDLTTNDFFVGIFVDEYGQTKRGTYAWTNTKANGDKATSDTSFSLGAHCRNWITSLSTINHLGAVGSTDLTGNDWSWKDSKMCGEQHSLYCFEQTSVTVPTPISTPSPTPPPPTPAPQPGNGDGNGDGRINLADLSVMFTDFNKASGIRRGIDLNGDGIINTPDYTLLINILIERGIIKG